jgi:hypothetical protein
MREKYTLRKMKRERETERTKTRNGYEYKNDQKKNIVKKKENVRTLNKE